ncbi:hypothetical protein ACIA03_20355 [Nocardioides sp. NPDC051685]|uniref:hypothetical protein n=1 Tax=Nocardioides sp. NPDC051685 TaxID=3364334 RepID=UPI0037BE0A37
MRTGVLLVAALAGLAAYERLVKPWQESWGARPEEKAMDLPGDDQVAEPATTVTRAITIDAAPEEVWPWLVQIGADRAGFYSYAWAENLIGLHIRNADRIEPAWQQLSVGDTVYADRGRTGGWTVVDLVPGEALVLRLADVSTGRPVSRRDPAAPGIGPVLDWEFAWIFALLPEPHGRTRLLIRERVGHGSTSARVLLAPLGQVSFVMTRKMLLGIKERAERVHPERAGSAT